MHLLPFVDTQHNVVRVLARAGGGCLKKEMPFGTVPCGRAVPPDVRRCPARVINIGSINGIGITSLDTYAYSASKAAVAHLTRVMGGKLGERRITVNAIMPGAFQSRMMRATLESFGDVIAKGVPLGRIGRAKDMVALSLLMAGPGGAWMTGSCVVLDGGAVVKPASL